MISFSSPRIDADVRLWAAQVVTNGGTVSMPRVAIVNSFVAAEKAGGPWALTDDYFPLWGENAIQGLTSLKQRRLATVVAAPTFTVNRGYTFDGVANYINTGFIPSTHAVALTFSNGRLAMYERLDFSSSNAAVGCQNTAANSILLSPRVTTTARFRILSGDLVTPTLPVATALGFTAASRNGTLTYKSYKNGVALADTSAIGVAASLQSVALYIGGLNPGQFRQTAPGFVCIGAALSNAQEAVQYANVQAWATSIGANV